MHTLWTADSALVCETPPAVAAAAARPGGLVRVRVDGLTSDGLEVGRYVGFTALQVSTVFCLCELTVGSVLQKER